MTNQLHNTATDRWVAERQARYGAERTRDLSGIDKKGLTLSLVELFQGHMRAVRTETDSGLALLVDEEGEVVEAGVDDVATFTETWGAPVTHERADAIAQGIRERDYRDPIRDEFERRVDRAMEIHREKAREAWELRSI
jgi:hypothetical protein